MRKSLTAKMLIMTFGSFLLLISGIITTLYIYFDKFYEPIKINHMIQSINEFTDSFEKNNWDDNQLYEEVFKFMKSQNVTMSIKPQVRNILAADSGKIIFQKSSVPYYTVNSSNMIQRQYDHPIDNWVVKQPGVAAFDINIQSVNIDEYGVSVSASINDKFVVYPNLQMPLVKTGGNIEEYKKAGISYSISTIPFTNYREVNFTKECTLGNGDIKYTNVTLSLQSVKEVTDFLLGIFPYLIAAAVILSVIMVFVYSRTISKPIVSLTKTANRMANMELGITSKVNRKDELGMLSASLNTLSDNLKKALDNLNEANSQLKEDYEKELCQEKVRKEFVANVSHELKTPLGIIKGYMEGIRDGVKIEKRTHYMEVILDEITHMDLMIKEMLEISRFDAGAVKFEKKSVSLDNMIERAIKIFESKAAEKSVAIKITGEYGICLIDEVKIQRVLNNLIENAVKYCNSNSIITVSGEKTEDTLTVRIQNDCPALSDDVLTKIWDRFYKADTSHNRDIEGTGLGLAITRSILEGHGCSYGVYNTECGVCFYFSLAVYTPSHPPVET